MATTIQKWGNSLGIRIPKSVAEKANLRLGAEIEIEAHGHMITVRPKRRRYTLATLLSKAKGPTPHRNLDRGEAVGRELV